jgi:hypothetical protein
MNDSTLHTTKKPGTATMPRKQATIHIYSVHITCYANEDIMARVERGEEFITQPSQLQGEMVYMGSSERLAAWHFYSAHKKASKNPLAYLVTLRKDSKTIMRIDVEH